MSEEIQLLFFETFSHDSTEDLNLDLVQFPCPVIVHEVRIIPLGTRVQVDVPGGVRLGATNPSTFKLELYANNLSQRDASTFEKLGILDYAANIDIQFEPLNKTATDGLIIKGWYGTITLAVYGVPTTIQPRGTSPPPPPPPQQRPKQTVETPPPAPPAIPSQLTAAGSLTPSDLPCLPSRNKVHKWLENSTRNPGTASHLSPSSPRTGPSWTPKDEVSPQKKDAPPAEPVPQAPAPAPIPNIIQADLAREIIQVLGAAAQSLEQNKILVPLTSQPPPDTRSVGSAPGFPVMPVVEPYRGCEDTPASPTGVDYGAPPVGDSLNTGYMGSTVEAGSTEVQPAVDYPGQPILEPTPVEWNPVLNQPAAYVPPIEPQPILTFSVQPVPLTTRLTVGVDNEHVEEILEPGFQDQQSQSPRDIPLEYTGRSLDPRIEPQDVPRDPRDLSAEMAEEFHREHIEKKRPHVEKRSRSRSTSRDRDYEKRSERGRDTREREIRDTSRESYRDKDDYDSRDSRGHSREHDWPRDHSEKSREIDKYRDSDRERTRDSDRDRSREDRDRTRDSDRGERTKDDRDKPRDKSREMDHERSRDRERTRDIDRDRDKERSRSGDIDKDRERTRDSDRHGPDRRDSDKDRRDFDRRDSDRDRRELDRDPKPKRDEERTRPPPEPPVEPIWEPDTPQEPDLAIDRGQVSEWREPPAAPNVWEHPPEPSWDYDRTREVPPREHVDPQSPRNIETIQTPRSPIRSQSPTPEGSPVQYQEVDMIGMSPERPETMPVDDPEQGQPATPPVEEEMPEDEIYGRLPMDSIIDETLVDDMQEGDGCSDISSDDNILTLEEVDKIGDWGDYETDDAWNFAISAFNPYQCYLAPLETFSDPSLTAYEVAKQKLVLVRSRPEEGEIPQEATEILSIIESFKNTDHHESWVEALEGLSHLLPNGLSYLINKSDNKEVLDTLIDWVFEGLDLQKAMNQPETAYKVRHLKIGVRLAGLLCSCDSYIAFRMLSKEVQQLLLQLFMSPHMASSIKLQILRSLDMSTRLRDGMDWFLGKHHLQQPDSSREIGYQMLVRLVTNKQVVRVSVALTALIRKVHVYEVFSKLKPAVLQLVESKSLPEAMSMSLLSMGACDDLDTVTDTTDKEQLMLLDVTVPLADDDVEPIVSCLEEIVKTVHNAENIIAQPKGGLPNQVQFSANAKFNPNPDIYHMFNSCEIMETLFVLLSSGATCIQNRIFAPIHSIFSHLITSLQGLVYLSSRAEDVINGIIRSLTQMPPVNELGVSEEDRVTDQHPAHQLGLALIYNLQALQHVDQLRSYHTKDELLKDVDNTEALGVLHALYTMTFTPQGREAFVYVLGLDNNIEVLMPFIEVTGEPVKDTRVRKSVCYSYTVLFLLMLLRYSNQISWLEKAASKIINYCEPADACSSKMAEKLSEIQDWVRPVKQCPKVSEDTVGEMIALLKLYKDDIAELPKALVTVLRILKHLGVPPKHGHTAQDNVIEIKYKYVLTAIFSAECLPDFYTILQKVGDLVLFPWQQGFPQNAQSRALILNMVQPVVELMKHILSDLINARGPEFKDLSCLPSLLHIHTVLCSWSNSGTLAPAIQQIQDDIVSVLLSFTQPVVQGDDSDQALSKSLWTQMVREVLKYGLLAPYTFLSGLILLSEMLPLPLPIQTKEPLSIDEVNAAVNNRKLWSAHLHPLTAEIMELLKCLAGSLCHPMQQVLRRVCWQLADLAVPTATTVVQCLLEILLTTMDTSRDQELSTLDPEARERAINSEVKSSPEISRMLSLIYFLMNQAPFKSAFLHVTRPGPKSETKFVNVLQRLVNLMNVVTESATSAAHTHAQEQIASILQSLCDCEVTLVSGPEVSFQEQLTNSLPCSEHVSVICEGLLGHMNHQDQKFSSILPALRTLTMLLDHDYGFYHVKRAMEKVPTAFFNLFMQINITFSKDSSDCIATLSSAAECIQFLVSLPEQPIDTPQGSPLDRTYTMSLVEVRHLLQWTSDAFAHPLEDLNSLLCEYVKEEEALKSVYESVNSLVTMLKSEEEDASQPRPDVTEPHLSEPETLPGQFSSRVVFTLTDDDDDRLSATYWLATPMLDDLDQEVEMVKSMVECNFEELSRTYCPDFDLKMELEKGSLPSDITATKPRRRRRGHDTINTSQMRGRNGGFVAPMRGGRGFGRGMPMSNSDKFRSRAPNTSRPPSMHVDDFVKMENQQGPNNQAQQGATSLRLQRQDKDMGGGGGGRGRGFESRGRGFFNRGGHFQRNSSPSGGYNRRDQGSMRGGFGNFRGSMLGGRGSLSQMGGGGGGQNYSSATSRGGSTMGGRGSPMKNSSPWRPTRQQGYGGSSSGGPRPFGRGDGRPGSADRMDRRRERIGGGGNRFQRGGSRGGGGGGGSGSWGDKGKGSDNRFMPPPGGGFHGRRDRGRHQRAFTK